MQNYRRDTRCQRPCKGKNSQANHNPHEAKSEATAVVKDLAKVRILKQITTELAASEYMAALSKTLQR